MYLHTEKPEKPNGLGFTNKMNIVSLLNPKPAMIIKSVLLVYQIKVFMSTTKDFKISALARALLYKVDPCEYQSPGIGMHLSDVATMGQYFYQN